MSTRKIVTTAAWVLGLAQGFVFSHPEFPIFVLIAAPIVGGIVLSWTWGYRWRDDAR